MDVKVCILYLIFVWEFLFIADFLILLNILSLCLKFPIHFFDLHFLCCGRLLVDEAADKVMQSSVQRLLLCGLYCQLMQKIVFYVPLMLPVRTYYQFSKL